jgi:hypothetical protein
MEKFLCSVSMVNSYGLWVTASLVKQVFGWCISHIFIFVSQLGLPTVVRSFAIEIIGVAFQLLPHLLVFSFHLLVFLFPFLLSIAPQGDALAGVGAVWRTITSWLRLALETGHSTNGGHVTGKIDLCRLLEVTMVLSRSISSLRSGLTVFRRH